MAFSSPQLPHNLLIFPFMAQGHTLPLIDLSKAFSCRGFSVTIITTPSNSSTISKYIQTHTNIHLKEIPFPQTKELPKGCENTSQLPSISLFVAFLKATEQLQQPFEQIMQDMFESESLPVCVISDFFLSWTVTACGKFGVPRFAFHGTGVLAMAITKSLVVHASSLVIGSETEPVRIPGIELPFTLTLADMPGLMKIVDLTDPFMQFMCEIGMWEKESSGIIVNSFMELESEHVSSLELFYKDGCKAWCVGPFLLYDEMERLNEPLKTDPYIKWLEDQDVSKSVIYVSFGTHAEISDMQLDEIAYGLEMSGYKFIWAVRSKTWAPPEGIEDRIKGMGWIVRDWVDQRTILAHGAIGGFLSHCGWNSVLESICAGVPLLVWPILGDQPLNAKLVVELLEAGLWVPIKRDEVVAVDREVIYDVVRELMGSEKGEKVREKAEALGKLARQAVRTGGSSHKNLNELTDFLCCARIKNNPQN